jgi:glycosyltransferase involved in cell wall biosynthesis
MTLRVALVHDWLTASGGAERVLAELLTLFPKADVFTLFGSTEALPRSAPAVAHLSKSWLASIPGMSRHYRAFAPLMPNAIESIRLRGFDLVISSSWAFAHGIRKPSGAKHLAYIHSPMRWAWDMEAEYLQQSGLEGKTLVGKTVESFVRWQLAKLRRWDRSAGQRPDALVANSAFVQQRIQNCWGRQSEVIYPPVTLPADWNTCAPKITPAKQTQRPYLSLSRLVPYKRVDAWIEAFRGMPDRQLLIAGDGPERARLEQLAPPNVTFLGWVSEAEAQRLLRTSRGYLQASKEDFGISVVEAQANGLPVLAYGVGGAQETVRDAGKHGMDRPTGLLIDNLEPHALVRAVTAFERIAFRPEDCRAHAERFSGERFRASVEAMVDRLIT